jgi:hypothetical protein
MARPCPLLFVLLSLIAIAPLQAEGNLIQNPGFEIVRDGRPVGWDASPAEAVSLTWKGAQAGAVSLRLDLGRPMTALVSQTVKVKPSAWYRLSLQVKTEKLEAVGPGAHIFISGLNALSNDFSGTTDGWQEAVLTIKTGPSQTTLAVAAEVGTKTQPAKGKAWFDSFIIEEGAPLAAGAQAGNASAAPFPWQLVVFAGAAALLLGVFAWLYRKNRPSLKKPLLDLVLAGGLTIVYAFIAFTNLGSFDAPQTYYQAESEGEGFILDLGERVPIAKLNYFLALGAGSFDLDFSNDLTAWNDRQTITQDNTYSMIEWRTMSVGATARYIRVTAVKPGVMLGEIGVFRRDTDALAPVKGIVPAQARLKPAGDPAAVIDEPGRVPGAPSYLNSMYFDETYHARTAFEYTQGRDATETTHPPLGKLTITSGLLLFGFTSFGWRFMGALFGIIMVPVMYAFGLALVKKRFLAFTAAFLFAFDFMHFVQTRIATIDVFGVFWIMLMYFFMYRALQENPFAKKPKKFLLFLFLSGLCFGLGAASKWIALYGAVGLALVLVVWYFYRLILRSRSFVRGLSGDRKKESDETVAFEPGEKERYALIVDRSRAILAFTLATALRTITVIAFALLVFVVLPALIYLASYIPFMQARGPLYPYTNPIELVVNEQKFMYDYHATLQATHPFSSMWYEWPVMSRPIWYYSGKANVPDTLTSSIAAFGNPAVWWPGALAAVFALVLAVKQAFKKKEGAGLFILVALAAQFVPWIVIPRKLTFIYHFFASVPFLVLGLIYVLKFVLDKWPKARWGVIALLGVVLGLFILFYPVLSGLPADSWFVEHVLRWFPGWVF